MMNLITGEGEAWVPSSLDISMDLLFLAQAVRVTVLVVKKQSVVVEIVDVVETDDTKNNRPFRLQNKIILNEKFLIKFTCWVMPTHFGLESGCKKATGRLQQALTSLICKRLNVMTIYDNNDNHQLLSWS